MSEPAAVPAAAESAALGHFTSRRLMSLFGVVPLGTFMVYHFYFHSFSHAGAAVYDENIRRLYAQPFHLAVAFLTVYLPLAWHSVLGFIVTTRSRPNFLQFTFFRNWMYTLQRASAIGLALFIPAHLVKARFSQVFFHQPIAWEHLNEGFRSPLTLGVYALGILGASFHLANGLWNFAVDWGILVGPRAQKAGSWVAVLSFLALAAMGFWAMSGFLAK
ncbi:MAG: succinate dehydrogenase [Candidatus Eisenbacteria bacterium]|nr:succinate dehydrogenase [Candidatus Eisenbacteria bacterium]